MKYTKQERVILINLFEIRKMLDSNNAESYEDKIEILKNGYESFYPEIERWVEETQPMTEEECSEVWDILLMYLAFEQTYKKEGKTPDTLAKFLGFYGNTERRQINFAEFILKKQENLSSIVQHLEEGLDCHTGDKLPFYRSMLKAWKKCPKGIPITSDDILDIIEQVKKEISET